MLKRSTNFTSKIKGIVSFKENTAMVIPISKGDERSYFIKGKNLTGVSAGDLVDCLITRKQLRHVKIIKVLRTLRKLCFATFFTTSVKCP